VRIVNYYRYPVIQLIINISLDFINRIFRYCGGELGNLLSSLNKVNIEVFGLYVVPIEIFIVDFVLSELGRDIRNKNCADKNGNEKFFHLTTLISSLEAKQLTCLCS